MIGFLSSLKIPTNTGDTGNHVWEPGFGLPVNYWSQSTMVGTLETGLINQVTPNFSVDVDSFFGLTRSGPDYNVFSGFGYRF